MYPIRFYVFEDATHPQVLPSYATLERLGIITFQVLNLAATHALDHVAVQIPSGKRKTAKQVTFQDPISMTEGSHTSSNLPDSQCGRRKTTVLNKGEEVLTSSHFKATNINQEVKVGSSILSKTLPSHQVPNSPASKTIRGPTLENAPSQCYQVNSPLLSGAVTPSDFPSQCGPGMGHYDLEKGLSRLF